MMCRYKGLVIETSRGHRSMLIHIQDIGHMDVTVLTGMMDLDMGTGIMTAMVALAAMVEATADMTVTITVVMDTTVDIGTMMAYLVLQSLPRLILAEMVTGVVEARAVVRAVARTVVRVAVQVVVMVAAAHQARRQLHGHLQTMFSVTKCSK